MSHTRIERLCRLRRCWLGFVFSLISVQCVSLEVLGKETSLLAQELSREGELVEGLIVLVLCMVLLLLKWHDSGVSMRGRLLSLLEWRPAPKHVNQSRAEFSLEQFRLAQLVEEERAREESYGGERESVIGSEVC